MRRLGRSHHRWALIVNCMVAGCAGRPLDVVFEVPQGYRGPLVFVSDALNGVDYKLLASGTVVIQAKGRVTHLRSLNILLGSLNVSCTYPDGSRFGYGYRVWASEESNSRLLLYGGDTIGRVENGRKVESVLFFLGTRSEYQQWRRSGMKESVPRTTG